ncbi:alpha/beta hydrolase family protein [Halopseudomonas pelagia]|uniref:alpha/beta hydrolase family protein n=1 Tax=Halopseudomonas pelagia TaxID=553151 RepID=UPI0030D8DB7C|tara:strand:+ start:5271 stop:7190 length:1920 start_codon:yes stop_codon:yes gene_type:complete
MNVPRESSAKAEQPGFWTSSLDAAQAVAAASDYADLVCDEQRLLWVEFHPEDGRSLIHEWTEAGQRCLTPPGYSARSRVYEYGGGALCLASGFLCFVNEDDQQIYVQGLHDLDCRALTQRGDCRYGALLNDPLRDRLIALEECHTATAVEHRLVAISYAGERDVITEGADFYNSPCLSPDGLHLAWIEWDRPHLPWTQTRLMSAVLNDRGQIVSKKSIPSAQPEVSQPEAFLPEAFQQPQFDSSGELLCLTDRSGYWLPWRVLADGGLESVPSQTADHAPAPWQLNPRHVLGLANGWLALSWLEGGYGHLALRHNTSAEERRLAHGYQRFRSLASNGRWLFCVAGSALCSAAIVRIDLHTHALQIIREVPAALPAEEVSQPQRLLYMSGGGDIAHGYFYPPCNCIHASPETLPPLLIFTHGGPTSATYAVLDNRIQYWTQRGFAVADLNYRGSVGFGRAYRQRLQGQWGVIDVEDVLAAIDHLVAAGRVDAAKVFIRGSSAGGYTTLCSLVAAGGRFRAAASLYGVSDPLRLRANTHKFEADYIDWLIGDPACDPERYLARSPLERAAEITTPVIFFQGLQDGVVLPEQTERMVAALQTHGVPVECLTFADERHGFRAAQTLRSVLEHELAFYQRWLQD